MASEYTHHFFKNLEGQFATDVQSFLAARDVCVEQNLEWQEKVVGNKNITFYLGYFNGTIVCYALIIETRKYEAFIPFGPLFLEPEHALEGLLAIQEFYANRKYIHVHIEPWTLAGQEWEYVVQKIAHRFDVRYFNKTAENWATLHLDLTLSEDELVKQFSKGHKSAIKKAQKSGLTIRSLTNNSEIRAFADIYIRMYQSRRIRVNETETVELFDRIFEFVNAKDRGVVLGAYNLDRQMIGGVILLRQGQLIRYFKGAADPAYRDLPILHTALFNGISIGKSWNANIFDLWGYALVADPDDQKYNINTFKKGFGGKLIIYGRTIDIVIRPLLYQVWHFILPKVRGSRNYLRKFRFKLFHPGKKQRK